MKPKRVRKNRKAWPNHVEAWIASLSAEQCAPLVQRAARVVGPGKGETEG
jgi:hypothetical protein